jgi:hypothetical protein
MTDQTALKIHYQNLKALCLLAASIRQAYANPETCTQQTTVAEAKRSYNEITDENWDGPQVEGA